MRRSMEKVNITVRFEQDTVAVLDDLAGVMDRDRSYLIKQAVSDYIAHNRWLVEEIRQAVTEANAGDFLPDAEAAAFMDELGR